MRWSLIIFCYNEGGNLADTASRCVSFLQQAATEFEVIIVNDGSTDNTAQVCAAMEVKYSGVKVIHHATNMGIGMALQTGYQSAAYDYVCAVPGDGQFDPFELAIVKPFGADTFYSFYRPKIDYNMYRKSLTVVNRLYNRFLLGIEMRDVNWIKVYRREQLLFADIQLNSSILESEICAKLIKCGARVTEIASVYKKRVAGEPKGGSWKTLKKAAGETWLLYRTVKKFSPVKMVELLLATQMLFLMGLI